MEDKIRQINDMLKTRVRYVQDVIEELTAIRERHGNLPICIGEGHLTCEGIDVVDDEVSSGDDGKYVLFWNIGQAFNAPDNAS